MEIGYGGGGVSIASICDRCLNEVRISVRLLESLRTEKMLEFVLITIEKGKPSAP
jgi:hypothetical protein